MALKKKRKSTISIPSLSDVETSTRFPEGVYQAKVVACEATTAKTGTEQIEWKFEITEGKYAGKKITHYTPLTESSLWKLKKLLEAIGYDIPEEEFDIDGEEVIDSELAIQIADHEWEGKVRSDVTDYAEAGVGEAEEADEPEEEDEPKAKGGKKVAPAAKGGKKKAEPEEEEEQDEPEPKAKAGKSKPAAKKAGKKKSAITEDDVKGMDQEELESFIEEHELDVDLDEFKTLTKKRAAVIKAAGELIAD